MADDGPSFQFDGDPDLQGAVEQATQAIRAGADSDERVAVVSLALLQYVRQAVAAVAPPEFPSRQEDGTVILGPGIVLNTEGRINFRDVSYVPMPLLDQALREQVNMIVARLQAERLGSIAQRVRQWYVS